MCHRNRYWHQVGFRAKADFAWGLAVSSDRPTPDQVRRTMSCLNGSAAGTTSLYREFSSWSRFPVRLRRLDGTGLGPKVHLVPDRRDQMVAIELRVPPGLR